MLTLLSFAMHLTPSPLSLLPSLLAAIKAARDGVGVEVKRTGEAWEKADWREEGRERESGGEENTRERSIFFLWILLSVRRKRDKSAWIFRAYFFLLCIISGNVLPEAGHCVIRITLSVIIQETKTRTRELTDLDHAYFHFLFSFFFLAVFSNNKFY
jgi:hypothetical protein